MSINKSEDIKAFRCPLCNKLIEIVNGGKEYVTIHGSLTLGDHMAFISGAGDKKTVRICTSCLIKKLGDNDFKDKFEIPDEPNRQSKNPKLDIKIRKPDDIKEMPFIGMPEGPWNDSK